MPTKRPDRPHVPWPDFSHSVIEPYIRLRSLLDRFDTSVKVASAGLDALHEKIEGDDSTAQLLQLAKSQLTAKTVTQPKRVLRDSQHVLASLWTVEALGMLELYLGLVIAELMRWEAAQGGVAPAVPTDPDGKVSLRALYGVNGWSTDVVTHYFPLLDYVQLCRNCVVHRMGLVSPALADVELDDGYATNWPTRSGEEVKAPKLPKLTAGKPLSLSPAHAIFFSTLVHRIAKDVNRRVVDSFGERGMIYHACHYMFFNDDPFEIEDSYLLAGHSANEAISYALTHRYVTRFVLPEDVSRTLRALDVWRRVPPAYGWKVRVAKERSKA